MDEEKEPLFVANRDYSTIEGQQYREERLIVESENKEDPLESYLPNDLRFCLSKEGGKNQVPSSQSEDLILDFNSSRRSQLAWMRTTLSLIGIGIILAKVFREPRVYEQNLFIFFFSYEMNLNLFFFSMITDETWIGFHWIGFCLLHLDALAFPKGKISLEQKRDFAQYLDDCFVQLIHLLCLYFIVGIFGLKFLFHI